MVSVPIFLQLKQQLQCRSSETYNPQTHKNAELNKIRGNSLLLYKRRLG
jgi:hypothetical protein